MVDGIGIYPQQFHPKFDGESRHGFSPSFRHHGDVSCPVEMNIQENTEVLVGFDPQPIWLCLEMGYTA
jgi:hypothetical protein